MLEKNKQKNIRIRWHHRLNVLNNYRTFYPKNSQYTLISTSILSKIDHFLIQKSISTSKGKLKYFLIFILAKME